MIFEARGLTKSYPAGRDVLGRVKSRFHAVDAVSFCLTEGETLAIVGESGAGKSTLGRLALRLVEPDAGTVLFDGVDLCSLGTRAVRRLRPRLQMIFQNPYSSLDPKMTIADSVAEPLVLHTGVSRRVREVTVVELLERVGIEREKMDRYPYELSGGQLQRVAIARALATDPDVIVCDEPVASLDVSIRAQVLNLLRDLQAERGLAYLFISHDLSLVQAFAHRIAVMYSGRIVEQGRSEQIFGDPQHPYTQRLLSAVLVPDPARRTIESMSEPVDRGEQEGSWNGCSYYRRCIKAIDRCRDEIPLLRVSAEGASVACHLADADESGAGTRH